MSTSNSDLTREDHTAKRNKVKAILAGGLVLGVGAAITLAAWTDTEFATGSFSSGSFGIEGKTASEADFAEHTTSPASAALTFTPATNMAPGSVRYASFDIQRTDATTVSALITADEPVTTGDLDGFLESEAVILAAGGTCDGTTFSASNTPFEFGGPGETIGEALGEAEVLHLCIKVTLVAEEGTSADAGQGDSGTMTWQFVGTQVVES